MESEQYLQIQPNLLSCHLHKYSAWTPTNSTIAQNGHAIFLKVYLSRILSIKLEDCYSYLIQS